MPSSPSELLQSVRDEFRLRDRGPLLLSSVVLFAAAWGIGGEAPAWRLALGLWVGYCASYALMALLVAASRSAAWMVPAASFAIVAGALLGRAAHPQGLAHDGWWSAGTALHLAFCGVFVVQPIVQVALRLRALHKLRAERALAQAELKMLQAQIEPHFLFNTLATLRGLIRQRSEQALPLLDHISGFLEAVLPRLREETSTVGRELQIVEQYLAIMGIRLGTRLRYGIECPPELAGCPLPPLLLQPLVENAVRHGIEPHEAGGEVRVRVELSGGTLSVSVLNDGAPLTHGAPGGHGIALGNLRDRLRSLYRDAARFTLRSVPRGTEAVLHLPVTIP